MATYFAYKTAEFSGDEEYYTESELESLFDDYLDDAEEWPTIAGAEYPPSRVLKSCDPTAYGTYFLDWLDGIDHEEISFDNFEDYADAIN